MATGKNINDSALQKVTDFTNVVNRLYASATSSTKDGYIILKELIDYILSQGGAGGDMTKAVYDDEANGVVNDSRLLNGSALENVNNTSDADKPISTATQAALDNKEQLIYIPTTQPAIAAGDLTLDMLSNRQAMFEGRLAIGTLTINSDFNFIISNDTNALLLSCVLSLTGTRIITFEADVLVSNASSIGTWAAPNLTLTAGTDDLIEFQLLRYSTSSKWILKVGEVAV